MTVEKSLLQENLGPYMTELEAGRQYLWCACGRSAGGIFCDGSHKGSEARPLRFTVPENGDAVLCGCKRTRNAPFCDGSHNNLSATYKPAKAEELAVADTLPVVPRSSGASGMARLPGGAFVLTIGDDMLVARSNLSVSPSVRRSDGAEYISQFYVSNVVQASQPIGFGDSHVVLFILGGKGSVRIGDRRFDIAREDTVSIQPHETFIVGAMDTEALELLVTVCPPTNGWSGQTPMTPYFNASVPDRIIHVDPARREPMGDRFYQVLVGEEENPPPLTQFIGELPQSRAAAHRHLYEECIVILSGAGFLRTEGAKAVVQTGDILFLPRKQLHSLECTVAGGMRLMGVFSPSGSPAINY